MHDELDSKYRDFADFSDIHWFSWATVLKKSGIQRTKTNTLLKRKKIRHFLMITFLTDLAFLMDDIFVILESF